MNVNSNDWCDLEIVKGLLEKLSDEQPEREEIFKAGVSLKGFIGRIEEDLTPKPYKPFVVTGIHPKIDGIDLNDPTLELKSRGGW